MASLTSSSCRSSSSYRSSARYSTSSSFRSESSLGGSSDSLDLLFEPFDSPDSSSLFVEESHGRPESLTPFSKHSRSPHGHTGSQCSAGAGIRCLGDSYCMETDVSHFEPHDVVVMAYNRHVVIHAEKVMDDGSISDTFTHKSLFPEDMDPLSVCGTLNPDGTLVVSVRRTKTPAGLDLVGAPTYCSEAHL
ncbi:heat shock protein beta-1 [Aulostomus maculatus]